MPTKKILIIEDEKSMIIPLQDKLSKSGYVVFVAYNGQEGLDLALQEKPDLILLDLLMPEKDGFTFLDDLRKKGGQYGKKAKVIILSNLSEENTPEFLKESKVLKYFIKANTSLDTILKTIKKII